MVPREALLVHGGSRVKTMISSVAQTGFAFSFFLPPLWSWLKLHKVSHPTELSPIILIAKAFEEAKQKPLVAMNKQVIHYDSLLIQSQTSQPFRLFQLLTADCEAQQKTDPKLFGTSTCILPASSLPKPG